MARNAERDRLLEAQAMEDGRPDDLMSDDNIVMVLDSENGLRATGNNDEDIQSPLRSINNVLQEAEHLLTDGPLEKTGDARTRVLMDEVDVEFSPMRNQVAGQPIEVIVRHSKVTSQRTEDDRISEDGPCTSTALPSGSVKRKMKLGTLREGREEVYQRPNALMSPEKPATSSWRKGHRRAFSMPNAKGEKLTLAVIQDHKELNEGAQRTRKILKYRIQSKGDVRPTDEMARPQRHERPTVHFADEVHNDDDNELEVEINEEEITYPADDDGKGGRTVMKRFWEARWKVQNFDMLPNWLQDNEYLKTGHRPPLASFSSCFKSIFAVHTETGNILTHLYGCVAFLGIAMWFLLRPGWQVALMEKLIFSCFFLGAVICMGMSFVFHTVQCHSDNVSKFFSKLDYTGITLLIVGSFIPWIYYGFYCRPQPMVIYISMITVLGIAAMIVSLWDKFAEPKFRPVRAGVFVAMGLSSVIPAIHFFVTDGFWIMWNDAALMWLLIMGFLYLFGATLYATRIPERFFPGKCDYIFQSHQLFHTFVVFAAYVHFHGITDMTMHRLQMGSCSEQLLERYGSETNPSWLGAMLGLDEPPNTRSWTPDDIPR